MKSSLVELDMAELGREIFDRRARAGESSEIVPYTWTAGNLPGGWRKISTLS